MSHRASKGPGSTAEPPPLDALLAERTALLERLTAALASSAEYPGGLQRLADIVVSEGLADWAVIAVLDGEGAGTVVPMAMATADTQFRSRLPELLRLYQPRPAATRGMARVI